MVDVPGMNALSPLWNVVVHAQFDIGHLNHLGSPGAMLRLAFANMEFMANRELLMLKPSATLYSPSSVVTMVQQAAHPAHSRTLKSLRVDARAVETHTQVNG